MALTTRRIFTLYVAWHPSFERGRVLADRLREHFGRDLYRSVTAGRGISVLYRSEPVPGKRRPLPIDWDDAEFTAVVALMDETLAEDAELADYVRDVAESQAEGLPAGFFPVTMDRRGLELGLHQQALRWDKWEGLDEGRLRRLTRDLTHELCRMLRHGLELPRASAAAPTRPSHESVDPLERYLKRIRVFISHSKHDGEGERVARDIRDWIHAHSPLDSFFDVHDLSPGLSFRDVLLHEIGDGAMVAVHTDSYSSREWCRREVIEAKRRLSPMVVVDCVRDIDPRGMAYLGNVPVVRMEPSCTDRIGIVAGCLLDDLFRTWLWRCRVATHTGDFPGVLFTARPPELITLASLASLPPRDVEDTPAIVHPEPRLSADEARLFSDVAPGVRVRMLTDWEEERS